MLDKLLRKTLEGDVRSAAKLMRLADDRSENFEIFMKEIWNHTGRAHIIGLTGVPGAGKSTLTDELISRYRELGKTVGVVAIDPSSPFSGGAILGDRVRMGRHNTDDDVFIRSLATRGCMGGLSVSAIDVAAIMDAMGKDVVIIETVGVGQDETDIVAVADTCLVVSIPGMGDDIQAIKSGILEIADIFVVNKADRDGADRTAIDLNLMLDIAGGKKWRAPVILTSALKKTGIESLMRAIEEHRHCLESSGRKRERQVHAIKSIITEKLSKTLLTQEKIDEYIVQHAGNPYITADFIWKTLGLE